MTPALFVVLDGVDGCGKSTQAALLCERLARAGRPAPLHLREPGSTRLGEALRGHLLETDWDLSPSVELMLFAAARRQLLDESIAPSLAGGRDVVCERFHPSTYAYQGVAGSLDPDQLLGLLLEWASTPSPAAELILELDVQTAAHRRGGDRDRMERKGQAFQEKVAEGYAQYVERIPQAHSIDANGSTDEVAQRIWQRIEPLLAVQSES